MVVKQCPGHKERLDDAWNSVHYKDGEHNDDFDHEAILGNKKTATEFENLSPEGNCVEIDLLMMTPVCRVKETPEAAGHARRHGRQ